MMPRNHLCVLVAAAGLLSPIAASAEPPAPAAHEASAPAVQPGAIEWRPDEHGAPEARHEASGKEKAEGGEHEEAEEHRWVFGSTFVALGPVARKSEAPALIGGGVFGEYTFVPRWLQGEVGLRFLAEGREKVVMPIDLLLKKPFELDHRAEAFLGVGGTLVPTISGEGELVGGLATAIGSYLWFSRDAGLAFELNYNLLVEEELVSELGGAVGLVYGL